MISADRLAELQADADRAAEEHTRLQDEQNALAEEANNSVGTEAQADRFAELMDNYARYTGTLDIGAYARLQAQRAMTGLPTEEARAFQQAAWETEKARRTAEDPTWKWGTCWIGPEIFDVQEPSPDESYDEFGARAGASGAFRTTQAERDAEGAVDPKECERRRRRWQELQTIANTYEYNRRMAEQEHPVLKGLIKVGDFLAGNVLGSLPLVGQVVGHAYKAIQKYQPSSKFYDPQQARRGFNFGKFVADTAVSSVKDLALAKVKGFAKDKAIKYVKGALRPHTNTINALKDRIARPLGSVRNRVLSNNSPTLLNNRRN
jgi:hypothetical protein